MEGGVEAGHPWSARERPADGVQRGKRLGLVKRGQVAERPQLPLHVLVDQRRPAEPLAAVDDPVADRVRGWKARDDRRELLGTRVGVERRKVMLGQERVAVSEQAQLKAARSGVDDQDPQLRRLHVGLGVRRAAGRDARR